MTKLFLSNLNLPVNCNQTEPQKKSTKQQAETAVSRKPYRPYVSYDADFTSLYILDKLPAGRWKGKLLAEAARLAKIDLGDLIKKHGGWPTTEDLRDAMAPPPAPPHLPLMPEIVRQHNLRLQPAAKLAAWFDSLAGHDDAGERLCEAAWFAGETPERVAAVLLAWGKDDLAAAMLAWIAEHSRASYTLTDRPRQISVVLSNWIEAMTVSNAADKTWCVAMDEWARRQIWAKVAQQAAKLTTAIRDHVGDSPYLRMIGYSYAEVCQQAEEDIEIAQLVVRAMERPEIDVELSHIQYVLSWGLDLNAVKPAKPVKVKPQGRLSLEERQAQCFAATREMEGMEDPEGYAHRVFDIRWHRRRLTKHINRTSEHVAMILRLVGAHGEVCVSDVALERRRDQIKRMLEYGESFAAFAPHDGADPIMMSTLMAASRKGQLASMWAIIQAMSDEARQRGLTPLWVTLTVPVQYHAAPKKGQDSYDPKLTPLDAKNWMQGEWQKARAWFAEKNIELFGVWVAEPNDDGCYHRHMLLWVPPEQEEGFRENITKYWEEDAAEAKKHGKASIDIDVKDDSATNSIARYIWAYLKPALLKSGDNWSGDDATYDAETEIKGKKGETAERYDAHAGTWGYRRYGFFGLASGTRTAWKKVYGWNEARNGDLPEGPFRAAKACMNGMDWHGALTELGAFSEKRFEIVGVESVNKYGEKVKTIKGVSDKTMSILMSCGWSIDRIIDDEEEYVDTDSYDILISWINFLESESFTLVVKDPRGEANASRGEQQKPAFGSAREAMRHIRSLYPPREAA